MTDSWQLKVGNLFAKIFSNGYTLEKSRWASIFPTEEEANLYAKKIGGEVVPFEGCQP